MSKASQILKLINIFMLYIAFISIMAMLLANSLEVRVVFLLVLISFIVGLFRICASRTKVMNTEKLKYDGNIHELTEIMIRQMGLEVKSKVGEYYIYDLSFIYSISKVHARELQGYCELITTRGFSEELKKMEKFRVLGEGDQKQEIYAGILH